MTEWLTKITDWFLALVKAVFSSLASIVGDFVVWVFQAVLGVVGDLLASLPVPSFMSSGTFGSILSGLPSFALYVVGQMHFAEAFAMIGAGVAFNLLRKLFTLGQW